MSAETGDDQIDRNSRAARRTRWFIAHEMAHFWLGSEGVGYSTPSDAWITEGGAEMMAFSLLAATDHDYVVGELQRAVDDCTKLATKPIAGAVERHESRAFYACGTVFALAASGAARRHGSDGFFGFLSPLLARHQTDRRLSGPAWLEHFDTVSGDATAGNVIRSLIEGGSARSVEDIGVILRSGGIPFSVTGNAIVVGPDAL